MCVYIYIYIYIYTRTHTYHAPTLRRGRGEPPTPARAPALRCCGHSLRRYVSGPNTTKRNNHTTTTTATTTTTTTSTTTTTTNNNNDDNSSDNNNEHEDLPGAGSLGVPPRFRASAGASGRERDRATARPFAISHPRFEIRNSCGRETRSLTTPSYIYIYIYIIIITILNNKL